MWPGAELIRYEYNHPVFGDLVRCACSPAIDYSCAVSLGVMPPEMGAAKILDIARDLRSMIYETAHRESARRVIMPHLVRLLARAEKMRPSTSELEATR